MSDHGWMANRCAACGLENPSDEHLVACHELDYTTDDVEPRHPDRWGFRHHWRAVVLIVAGFSVLQVLWLVALGWRP